MYANNVCKVTKIILNTKTKSQISELFYLKKLFSIKNFAVLLFFLPRCSIFASSKSNPITMNRLASIMVLVLSVFGQTSAQVSFGSAERFNEGWLFLRADSAWNIFESPDMKNIDYDDSRWRRVTLPHDWGVELPN